MQVRIYFSKDMHKEKATMGLFFMQKKSGWLNAVSVFKYYVSHNRIHVLYGIYFTYISPKKVDHLEVQDT